MAELDAQFPKIKMVTVAQRFRMDCETPVSLFLKMALDQPYSFVLESVEHGQHSGRFSFVGWDPILHFTFKPNLVRIDGVVQREFHSSQPLDLLKSLLGHIEMMDHQAIPNARGGFVGNISYDAIRLVENIGPAHADDSHWIDLMLPRTLLVIDHLDHTVTVLCHSVDDRDDQTQAREEAQALLKRTLDRIRLFSVSTDTVSNPDRPVDLDAWTSNLSRDQFCELVEQAKKHIIDGDIFQVVLSRAIRRAFRADPFEIYRALRQINPSPYMFYLKQGTRAIVGGSPEALVCIEQGMMETHPIAGTRPRGATLEEDLALEQGLLADEKEISEHVMLVDLGRNDLGRVAEPGSVSVPRFMQIERYSHVMHIVSVVKAKLREDLHPFDAMMSVFPAGTLSGAPKIRAMQIINAFEPENRGVYGGAIGFIDFTGNMDSCIAIRTATVEHGVVRIQAGAGLVADSQPESEYAETHHKMMSMILAVERAIQHAESKS